MSEVRDDILKNTRFGELNELFVQIMELPDDVLSEAVVDSLRGAINGAITDAMKKQAVKNIINECINNNYARQFLKDIAKESNEEILEYINQLQPSAQKRLLLNDIAAIMNEIFEDALVQYHGVNFQLPIVLQGAAKAPSYAHLDDAAADIYAAKDITLKAHSLSNHINTSLYIALPEGWTALILPRSSIGAKTGLRLSNSIGVIDSSYRGEIGVLYDNIADTDYTIHAGERIAQMLVIPTYVFATKIVDTLDNTERGEGGFGSTGV